MAALSTRRENAEAEVERLDTSIRATRGWDLSLKGGYDRLLSRQEDLPIFGMVTLTVNLGWPFMGGGNQRAISGRREWAKRQLGGVTDFAETHALRLKALLKAEQTRLGQAASLLAVLDERKKEIGALPGDRARGFLDDLWLDWVRVKAQHEYLRVHAEELERLISGEAPR